MRPYTSVCGLNIQVHAALLVYAALTYWCMLLVYAALSYKWLFHALSHALSTERSSAPIPRLFVSLSSHMSLHPVSQLSLSSISLSLLSLSLTRQLILLSLTKSVSLSWHAK